MRPAVAEPDVGDGGVGGGVGPGVGGERAAEGRGAVQGGRLDHPHLGVALDEDGGAVPDLVGRWW